MEIFKNENWSLRFDGKHLIQSIKWF